MPKIKSYGLINESEVGNNDVLLIETDNGTKTVNAKKLFDGYTRDEINSLLIDMMEITPVLTSPTANESVSIGQVYRVDNGSNTYSFYFKTGNGTFFEIPNSLAIDSKLDDENGVIETDHIQNGAVTVDKISDGFKQYVQNSLNGKVSTSDKIARIEVPASLTTGLDGVTHARFPELDTSNKVLKIPRGMLLIMRNGQNINLAPSGIVPISYSDVTTTTTKVLYNISTNTFRAVSTDDTSSTNNDVLICTIRDGSNFELTDHGMSIACPYIIDGKFFGVNLADYIANNSITEAQLSTAYKQSVQDSVNGLAANFQNVVNGLSTNINAVKKMSLCNLIKGATFTFGSVANSTGTETAVNNHICSGFIGVSDARFLECSIASGYKYAVTCYDSQKTFIGATLGSLYWRWHSYHTDECVIPLLPTIKYIRITISDTSDSNNITLEDSNKIKVLADYSEYRQFQFLNNYCGKLQESPISHDIWEIGGTNDGNSTITNEPKRLWSGVIELPKSGTFNINTTAGYKACYALFDENMTQISRSGWTARHSVEILSTYKWIIVCLATADLQGVMQPSDGSNCTMSYVPTVTVENIVSNYENVQHVDNIIPNPCTDIGWEYGILWENVEADSNTPFTRIRSDFILVGKGTRVKCNPSYNHLVFKYDRRKKWISNDTLYTSNEKVIDEECFIRIVMAKVDNSAISENEISTIANTEIIIRQLPQSIVENASDFRDSIPSYYQPQLKAAIDSALNNIVAAGKNGESFIFISDPHEEANAGYSPRLIKEITKRVNIDKIICGGDMIEGGNKATIIKKFNDFVSAFRPAGKFFAAFGNHDTNTIGPNGQNPATEHLTKGEAYALMQKQIDYRVQYGDLCYYFFDNPTTKTRFIVLDTGLEGTGLDSAQRAWFENALNNMPNSYHALIFAHIIYVSSNWYVGVSPNAFTRTGFMDDICAICDAFNSAANGKTVEAIFGGHTHLDGEYSSTGGIPIIIIDCDARTTASADGQGNRDAVLGTITEQCFDIVTVDYAAKKIKCVRIGRGSDRTISYSEGE